MTRLHLVALLALAACSKKPDETPPAAKNRCEVDLGATGLFANAGDGASAQVIDHASQLIGGEGATGRLGDVLLQNDRIRVVIEQPGRSVGPVWNGGHLIDADVQRPSGEPGRDAFGRMNLIYAMGRLSSVHQVEVLSDGSRGGPAVVASTGHDALHDLINLRALLANEAGLSVDFVVDQYKPLPLRTTTYYVLSPGENRVRVLTAFCNDGSTGQAMPLIELMDVGAFELFFPEGCSNALGAQIDLDGCLVQTSRWFAAQGRGVAYGYRPMALDDLKKPSGKNAMIGYGGVVGTFIEGDSLSGLLAWTDASARTRPGAFAVRPGSLKLSLSDLVVATDVAGVSSAFHAYEGVPTGHLDFTTPVAGARISVSNQFGVMKTLVTTDADGRGRVDLPTGQYRFTATTEGRLIGPTRELTVTAGTTQTLALELQPVRTLHVSVRDVSGAPSPGKVTVLCHGGPCPFNQDTWKQHFLRDYPQGGAAAIDYVGMTGELDLQLPPGRYDVVVSRGPEYSVWPDTWPNAGQLVELGAADASVQAVVGRVVDSTGWMSADLHVHAVNSADSAVPNEQRVLNFLSEGVDVLLSTDHEFITDYGPTVRALGAQEVMATMIGEEVTSFSHGHFNTFPLVRDPKLPNGGAFDHAGGEEGPTLRMPQLYAGIKAAHPGAVVQLNHPRGAGGGVLTMLKVDTATLKSHGNPEDYNMAADPAATSEDSRLFGAGFDCIEAANGPTPSFAVLNDWMTFLSRGTVRTATGVSDTHDAASNNGGYARTYAQVGVDTPAGFTPLKFADAMREHRAFVSNGPYLKLSARKASGSDPVEIGGTLKVAAGGEDVELTVDVTGPEWLNVDRVEIYTHAAGRDAVNGEGNAAWPDSRILQKHLLGSLTIEAVPGPGNLRRVHQVERFTVHPTADTWYVAVARATSGRTLWPLHTARAFAFTNAITIDADGSGEYDLYPLAPGQGLSAPRQAPAASPPIVPTVSQAEAAIRRLLLHQHQ
ncbi:MAG: CehA/McbA family metallohydrolase [Archangiaceae bacterium]|nr:CehA/McbA family metallohydrolase [Archangiaceae bacterium]